MGRVTVDDAVSWIGRFKNGALANLEATRFALGRKNHITLEINGSKGSLAFDFEDMNRLEYYNADDPADRRGFRGILVTEAHPSLRRRLVAAGPHHRLRAHFREYLRGFRPGGRRRQKRAADIRGRPAKRKSPRRRRGKRKDAPMGEGKLD